MTLAVWLALLPLRLMAALGLRRSVILACLFILAVTVIGVAEDLGLLDPPAAAKPARPPRPASQADPSAAARADIPTDYLRLYRLAAGRCPGLPWSVLAAIGKVESDHGRSPLPGVHSGWNAAGAAGPMQFGIGTGRAGNAWARYGHDFDRDGRTSVYDPGDAIPAAADYLCAYGAPRRLDQALHAYNHSWPYVATVKAIAARYRTQEGGGHDCSQVGRPSALPAVRQSHPARCSRRGPRRPDQTAPQGRRRPLAVPALRSRGQRHRPPPAPRERSAAVSGHLVLDPALLPGVGFPGRAPAMPSVPRSGARWVGANPEPTPRTDAPPPPTPTHAGRR